jgi:hypothetical protein
MGNENVFNYPVVYDGVDLSILYGFSLNKNTPGLEILIVISSANSEIN